MDDSEPDPNFEETETDEPTETDPFKPHEGVPRQDEPENEKEPGHGKKVRANILYESVGAESFSETDHLTETDPVKPHEGVPRQDEPENIKEPGHGKKAAAKILKESVEAESSFGELSSAESDLQLAAVYPSRHGCPSRCSQNTRRQLKLKLL